MGKKNNKNKPTSKQLAPKSNKSSYDWFRNNSNVGDSKNPKSILTRKNIWRFFKIFIFLFLFSCTATGCVQTMVIRNDSQVGNGVELYSSEQKIAPHVTTFEINEIESDSNKNLYVLEKNSKNLLIKDEKELKDIHDEISENQKHKMVDAYKGVNESFLIFGNGLKDVLEESKVERYHSRPIVLSSSFEGDEEGMNYLFKDLKVDDVKLLDGESFFDEIVGLEIINIDKDKNESKWKIKSNSLSLSKKTKESSRQQFSLAVSQVLLQKKLSNDQELGQWIITSLKNGNKEQKIASSNILSAIFRYAGIQRDSHNGISFTGQVFMPGIENGKDTNYRPIASWGQAWTRLGPFYGAFVYPISYLNSAIINSLGDLNGWESVITMIIVVIMIRLLIFGLGFKSTLQQTKMQELSGKRASIEAKYAPYKGNKQMENRKRQEMSALYKKEGISPAGQFANALISMPFFLSVWRVTTSNPQIKSTIWLGIDFSSTSWRRLFAGEVRYLPIIFFAALFSLAQQLVPRLLANRRNRKQINVHQKEAMRKNNRMQNIMMIVFVFFAIAFNAGIQIYWIISGAWMVCQGFFTHYLFLKQKERNKRKKLGI